MDTTPCENVEFQARMWNSSLGVHDHNVEFKELKYNHNILTEIIVGTSTYFYRASVGVKNSRQEHGIILTQ